MSKHICPKCTHEFEHRSLAARTVLGTAGALLARKNPGFALIASGVGILIGHEIDKYLATQVDPKCPMCGFVIRVIAQSI